MSGLEFDEFEEAMRGVEGRYIPLKRDTHDWRLQSLALADIEVMLCQNGGGSIYDGACYNENFGLFFPLSKIDHLLVNGREVGDSTLTWLSAGRDFHIYNSGVLRWVGISVGHQTISRWLDLDTEGTRLDRHEHLIGHGHPQRMAELTDLVIRMFDVNDATPAILDASASRGELYEQLAHGIHDALQSMEPATTGTLGRPRMSRSEIIRCALKLLDFPLGESVRLADLCRAAGVSSRTLHAAFNEHFGVSPHRFLMLKRLRAIHEALRLAEPSETVAQICGRFGVWDFGRFSGLYRRVYGVPPSRALAAKRPGLTA